MARSRRACVLAAMVVVAIVASSGCTLYGWGANGNGQLGTGFLFPEARPTPVARNPGWVAADAGFDQTCAIDEASALWCWGDNSRGQIGVGAAGGSHTMPERVGTDNDWTEVSTNVDHTCGIRGAGSLFCWGANSSAQIGDGTTTDRPSPTAVTGTEWTHVSVGAFYTCGIRAGELHCWGENGFGAMGIGTQPYSLVPIRVGVASDWMTVEAGFNHTCGIRSPGYLYCWGYNQDGQVGDGTLVDRNVPTPVGTGTNWMAVTAGEHTCGIRRLVPTTAGRLWCWGTNDNGQLGDGTKTNRALPVVVGTDTDWRAISAGTWTTCGIRASWLAYCWGSNSSGQVGNGAGGTGVDVVTPTKLPGDDWGLVTVGLNHVLGARNVPD